MADALVELARVLFYSKDAKVTKQEAEVILACRSKALRDATVGGAIAGGLVWMTTGKLSKVSSFFRSNLAGGLGFLTGVWSLNRSVDSCVDHILAMEGTRMKHELARIMVRRYGHDPKKMHLISKHFFLEEVFDDSASDQPKRMFRQRNNYIDNAAQLQTSPDSYGHEDSEANRKDDNSQKKLGNDFERIRKTAMELKQASVVRGNAGQDDPLDYLLGNSDVNEDVLHPTATTSENPTRQQTRRQRRLHRRHRLHHRHRERDDPSTTENE